MPNPEQKTRIIHLNVNGVDFEIPRDADDPRPDNEITTGGVVLDLDTGDIRLDKSDKSSDKSNEGGE